MQTIRLSRNVVLEITDEITTVPLNGSPSLHIYEYGSRYNNTKQVLFSDGQTEERTKSYLSSAGNILLSTTPKFYPDVAISENFHENSRIDNLITSEPLINPLQYRKVRMLFAQGFSYDIGDNGVALTTLNINAVRPSNNSRVELLSYYDAYDNSSLMAIPQVLFDNQLFNTAIELRIIDLAFLFNSESTDVIAIKERLFGNDNIETLFVEHAGIPFNEIIDFNEGVDTFRRFSDPLRIRTQFSPRFNNDEIICNVSKRPNGTVTSEMVHERFNLEGFLSKTSEVVDVSHTYKFDQYDSSNSLLGSSIVKVSSPTNLFQKASYRITPLDDTDHIEVTVECFILQQDNTRIYRSGTVVLTDVTPLKTNVINAILEEETLIRSDIKEVRQVVYKPDTPKIINIEKPVYVQISTQENEITLTPFNQALKILVDADLSLVRKLKLRIGKNSYFSEGNDKLTFRVGSESYYTKENTYYLMDEQDNVVTYGDIKRVSE